MASGIGLMVLLAAVYLLLLLAEAADRISRAMGWGQDDD